MNEVLIVDDEVAVCQLAKRYLAEEDISVTALLDGQEVMKFIQERKPSVIILDVYFPDHNGLELLRAIRSQAPHIPVIMITGHSDPLQASWASQMGACDYLSKPLDWSYLKDVVYLYSFLGDTPDPFATESEETTEPA